MHKSSLSLTLLLTVLILGCSGGGQRIKIDGSSTVYPITEAVAEEYRAEEANVRVTVGFSGTGGGFKKFIRGETDINDASRPISKEERKKAKENGIEFVELKVAFDGMAVVANPENDWLDTISVGELKKIWEPEAEGEVTQWSDVRDEWPEEKFHLYGPGVQSGTYDYFTRAIVGDAGSSRGDYTSSEDDNTLVQGVKGEKYSLGFFGFAYYEENKESLKLIAVDDGNGGIHPSKESISTKEYSPLTRPLYIYVRKKAAGEEHVKDFVEFYLNKASDLVHEVGYFPMQDENYDTELEKFREFSKKAGKGKGKS